MQAADVMTPNVITVGPDSEVLEIATLLLEHGISAVPVVDAENRVLGIVSEGDLMRRVDNEDEHHKSWWLRIFSDSTPSDYVKSHGRHARYIMTADPICIDEHEPLYRIAKLLEKHRIKRVPVVRDGKLVGIVSRANLLRGFSATAPDIAPNVDDREIRDAIRQEIDENTGVVVEHINVIVADGKVQLWGLVETKEEKLAAQVAAENTPGVNSVENNLGFLPRGMSSF
jgi:CBS domain-containing protein